MLGFRGRQVLAYVQQSTAAGKRPPSYAMIARALGMNSVADVCKVVRRLERRGLLGTSDTGSRLLRGWHQPVIIMAS